jgi:hypothetical protein
LLSANLQKEVSSKYDEDVFVALSKLDERFAKLVHMEEKIDEIRDRFSLIKTGREKAFVKRLDPVSITLGAIALGKLLAPYVAGWAVGKVLDGVAKRGWKKFKGFFRKNKKDDDLESKVEALSKLIQEQQKQKQHQLDPVEIEKILEKTKNLGTADTHWCGSCRNVFYNDKEFVEH